MSHVTNFPHIARPPWTASLGLMSIALLVAAGCASVPPQAASQQAASQQAASQQVTARQVSSNELPQKSAVPKSKSPLDRKVGSLPPLAKSFEEAVTRGDAAWHDGEADMAIYLYVQALSYRPRDVGTLGKIGSIEQIRGNLALAASAFELAAKTDPSDVRVTGRLGLILLALGQDESAKSWLQKSVEAKTADWRVYDGLAVIELRRGDNTNALVHLKQAVLLAPDIPTPLIHRARAMLGSGDYAGAEATVGVALGLGNASAEAWRLLGEAQAKRRFYAKSTESLLHVLEASAAYNLVGQLAMENEDNAEALRYFEKASAASPLFLADAQRNAAIVRERLSSSR